MHNFKLEKYFFVDNFEPNLIKCQDKNITIIYRNYNNEINLNEVIKLKNYCKKLNIKFLLSNNIKLALKLNLNGVYLPSFNKSYNHLHYTLKKKFILIGSAHNLKEIKIKEKQKIEKIFLSSIFKKNKNYLGINRFKSFSKYSCKKLIALGGISDDNIKKISLTNAVGFAGISYFKKKGPLVTRGLLK